MAVVGLHSFSRDSSTESLLVYYLCGFAIPFFFMSSGFFLLNRSKISWNYPLKKTLAILRIVVLWDLIFFILKSVIKVYSTGKLYFDLLGFPKEVIRSLLQKGEMGHFWYLGALIILYFLLPWISKRSLEGKGFFLFAAGIICFVFQAVSFFVKYPLRAYVIQTFRVWTWFFYFLLGGFIERIMFWIKNRMRFGRHLALTAVVTGIVLIVHYIIGTKVVLLGENTLKAEYFYDSILDIVWVTCFFSLLIRVKLHEHTELVIQRIASLTLGVYIIHFPLRSIVAHIIKVNSFTNAIVFWLIVLTASTGITWVIGETKIGWYLTKI